MIVIGADVVES
jgi:mRNA interferase HigB